MQWMHMREHQAFQKWKAHWYEKEQVVMKVFKTRVLLHQEAMERIARRWSNLEMLFAWNTWQGLLEIRRENERKRRAISGHADLHREHQLQELQVQRRRRVHRELSTKEIMMQAALALATSEGLEKSIAFLVVVSVVLMGLQGTCDSAMGRVLGCSSGDRSSFVVFSTVVEALLLTATCLFALEALLKLLALGPTKYLSTFGNIFDFAIAIVALTEIGAVVSQLSCQIHAIENELTDDPTRCLTQATGAQALRAFRLVRLARLLRRYPSIRRIGLLFSYVLSQSWGECVSQTPGKAPD